MNVDREFEFPTELLVHPQALVGISGLDTLNNAVHRATWDALGNNRRQERALVQFKLLSATHEFPRPKAKAPSYDAHIPKGILKRAWMRKHLTQIPAVVAIFFDLDWDDRNWEEKKIECISRVRHIRAALEGRSTRICLVLIQSTAVLPSSDDTLADERANSLFMEAELNNKSLFLLPHTDHLLGFTSKLEKAFYELASSYYQSEIKLIKLHRNSMNKKNHQYLFVRHHFKMGFFSELRQDLESAHSHYKEAYDNLLEVRLSDTNEFEVKTIAGYVSYKVCRVHFALKTPKDAISHFKAHIEHYKHKTGHALLLFQHYAWLSKQFSMFAELFDEVVHQGLPAAQTQHPGFFYKTAAKYAEQRKTMCRQLCSGVKNYPQPDPLNDRDKLEFYGQRPWRPCQLSAEPLDPDLERLGILAIQYNEYFNTDHSGMIIGLLGNAISQFKNYKCPRMRRHLVVRMADEYYEAKDYGKALTLLTHMLWDYRIEKWYTIVDRLMTTALCSAFLTASVFEYVTLCLEAVRRFSNVPQESIRMLKNVIAVTSVEGVPSAEPGLPTVEVSEALEKWKIARPEVFPMVVDSSLFLSPVQCKAFITSQEYDSVQITFVIRSLFPETFVFNKLSVTLTRASGEVKEYDVEDKVNLCFEPGQLKYFKTIIVPLQSDIGKTIQITSVNMVIGEVVERQVVLKFSGLGADPNSTYPELLYFKQIRGDEWEFMKTKPCLTCIVPRREAKVTLKVHHKAPALLNEWYPLNVIVVNKETSPVSDVCWTISFTDPNAPQMNVFKEKDSESLTSLPLAFKLPTLPERLQKSFYVKPNSLEARQLDFKLSYSVEGHVCICESQVYFEVHRPFEFNTEYLSNKFETLSELYTRGPFIVRPKIKSLSPWPLVINSTSFKWGDQFSVEGDSESVLNGCVLEEGNEGTEMVCVSTLTPSEKPVPVGEYALKWSRFGETESTVDSYVLPHISVEETPVTVSLNAPPLGILMNLYTVKYLITNHSEKLHVLQVHVESSNTFMFAGLGQGLLYLQPSSTKEIKYNMYPLYCGQMSLPQLKVKSVKEGELTYLTKVIERALPANVYIMPRGKIVE